VPVRAKGHQHLLHRLSFQAFHGAIPPGAQIMHSCDVRGCGCPDHLGAGSAKDNQADCKARGRLGRRGGRRLTFETAGQVRAANGKHKDIAAQFGVTVQTVSLIKRGRIWRDA
jgi:hypothetical protein